MQIFEILFQSLRNGFRFIDRSLNRINIRTNSFEFLMQSAIILLEIVLRKHKIQISKSIFSSFAYRNDRMLVLIHQRSQPFDFHLQLNDLSAVFVLIDLHSISDISRALSVIQRAFRFWKISINRRHTGDHQRSTTNKHSNRFSFLVIRVFTCFHRENLVINELISNHDTAHELLFSSDRRELKWHSREPTKSVEWMLNSEWISRTYETAVDADAFFRSLAGRTCSF